MSPIPTIKDAAVRRRTQMTRRGDSLTRVEVTELELEIPVRTVSEPNRRDHWATVARRKTQQRNAVSWEWARVSGAGRRAVVKFPAVVTLTRLAPRSLDDDNLRGALKAVRDQLAEEMGLPNDRDARVTWDYRQEQSRRYGVRVQIRSI